MLYGSSTSTSVPRLAGPRVDRRQAAVGAALGIVGDPQRAQVPRRHDVLRAEADLEPVDHLHHRRVDHVDVVGAQVRHVDAFAGLPRTTALSLSAVTSLYRLFGSGTGGMPGQRALAPPRRSAAAKEARGDRPARLAAPRPCGSRSAVLRLRVYLLRRGGRRARWIAATDASTMRVDAGRPSAAVAARGSPETPRRHRPPRRARRDGRAADRSPARARCPPGRHGCRSRVGEASRLQHLDVVRLHDAIVLGQRMHPARRRRAACVLTLAATRSKLAR